MQRPGRGTSRGAVAAVLTALLVVVAGLAGGGVASSVARARAATTPSRQVSAPHRYVDPASGAGRQATVAPTHRRAVAEHPHQGGCAAVLPVAGGVAAGRPSGRVDVAVGHRPASAARTGADSRAPPA